MKSKLMVILAVFLFGCTSGVKEIKRWEVVCFNQMGDTIVTDTLLGGHLMEWRGTIKHMRIHTQFHGANAIYTGNCAAKMLESYYTETVY